MPTQNTRIPLITTPITLAQPGIPALGLEPLWFRWIQGVDAFVSASPNPPITPLDFSRVPKITTPTTPGPLWVGKCFAMSAGITLPANVFSLTSTAVSGEGDIFTLYNATNASLIITAGAGLTFYVNGVAVASGTIAMRSLVTIWYALTNEAVSSGAIS